ncbi:MAG: hypothetical protein QOJ39_2465 [Candidatus Eremiobacteraeota bacterium]|jgi:hypothetical protein|nr:hypothetical protein [Candidatus Eremiobacteraeota bacterium]MEA2720601.1 hypothetical protein [Candidatus Eremiobacteraeota bacterium]
MVVLPENTPDPTRGTGTDTPAANAVTLTTPGVVRTTAFTTVPEPTTLGLTLAPRICGTTGGGAAFDPAARSPARAVAGACAAAPGAVVTAGGVAAGGTVEAAGANVGAPAAAVAVLVAPAVPAVVLVVVPRAHAVRQTAVASAAASDFTTGGTSEAQRQKLK